jgi:hypothetical protein
MAEYACPCGCGLRINVDRSCCTPAYNRLPDGLRRRMEASYLVARSNPGARRAAFAEVAEWLRDNPGVGS